MGLGEGPDELSVYGENNGQQMVTSLTPPGLLDSEVVKTIKWSSSLYLHTSWERSPSTNDQGHTWSESDFSCLEIII